MFLNSQVLVPPSQNGSGLFTELQCYSTQFSMDCKKKKNVGRTRGISSMWIRLNFLLLITDDRDAYSIFFFSLSETRRKNTSMPNLRHLSNEFI